MEEKMIDSIRDWFMNILILGAPLIFNRIFLGKFLPFSWVSIAMLVLWWVIAPLIARFMHPDFSQCAGYLWYALLSLALATSILVCALSGASARSILMAVLFQSYTILCAFYYGGIEATQKFGP